MKTTLFTTPQPASANPDALSLTCPLPPQLPTAGPGETVKHILIGSPGAIRQTIHRLHILNYSETVLWSPVLRIEEPLTVTTEQGEAMSLLHKKV